MKVLTKGTMEIKFYEENGNKVIEAIKDNRQVCKVFVSKILGNGYYVALRDSNDTTCWEAMLDSLYLDVCVLNNDFDTYSDVYKDIYHIRPHLTQKEWNTKVDIVKRRGIN